MSEITSPTHASVPTRRLIDPLLENKNAVVYGGSGSAGGAVLSEEGWIKVLKLEEYAPRLPRRPDKLQQILFPYTEAV